MSITLVGIDGPRAGERIDLDDASLELAGAPDTAPAALLTPDGDGLRLKELGDAGVWLNGHRVIEAPVHDGDQLQVGASRFKVEGGGQVSWRCPACGLGQAAVPADRCPRCGRDARVVDMLPDGPVAQKFCQACGRNMPVDAKFCPACGKDQEPAVAESPAPSGGVPRWVWPTVAVVVILLLLLLVGGVLVFVGVVAKSLSRTVAELPLPQPPAVTAPASSEPAPPIMAEEPPPVELPAVGKVKLRYGGRAGDSFHYRATGQVDGTMSVMGQSMPLQVSTSNGYQQDVLEADGQHLKFRLTPDPMGVQQNGQPFAGALPATPGPVTVTMDRRGRMQHVDSMGGGETVPMPGLPGGIALDQKAIVEQLSAAALPEEAVGVGDTWTHQVTVPLGDGGSMSITTHSRLDGFELRNGHRTARVISEMSAPIQMNLTDPKDSAAIDQSGSIQGTVKTWFDPKRGVLVASDSDLKLDMSMKLADGASAPPVEGVPGLEQLLGKQGDLTLKASGTIRQKVELDENE